MSEELARKLIEDSGGTVEEVGGPLPDGSGFMIGSFPLRKDHWLYDNEDDPPMPFQCGANASVDIHLPRKEFEKKILQAAKYAVRVTTDHGNITDFDPDAMIRNFEIGMCGYWTEDGAPSFSLDAPSPLDAPSRLDVPQMSLTVEQAREKRVCRICEGLIKVVGVPVDWEFEFNTLEFPVKLTLNFGKEFAHTECVERENKY